VSANVFPFDLTDLKYWVTKRKDGIIVKHTLDEGRSTRESKTTAMTTYGKGTAWSQAATVHTQARLSDFCVHNPVEPLFLTTELNEANNPRIALYIADAAGARSHRARFDYIIDGGNVIFNPAPSVFSGDAALAAELEQYSKTKPTTRVLKIDWEDRKDPPLRPEFWRALSEKVSGKVLVCCQGGHGRSGSSAVALMMMLSDYTAKEAIIHLRALHCPRAIESHIQHDYLNEVSAWLERAEDAHEVEEIKDYREAFRTLAQTNVTAKRFLHWLKGPK
jgi:hypothetical protein